jgi:hypothetical protein
MECDLAYEDMEGFFIFENMHLENSHVDQYSKIV